MGSGRASPGCGAAVPARRTGRPDPGSRLAKSQTGLVPDHWTRKQTTVNAERYISPELKELEHAILSAQDQVTALEYQLFCQLKEAVCAQVERIQKTAAALAQVDVLQSFAAVAAANGYCMPYRRSAPAPPGRWPCRRR